MQVKKISGGEIVRPRETNPLYYRTHFVDRTRLCPATWGAECPWCETHLHKAKAFVAVAMANSGPTFIEVPRITVERMLEEHPKPWMRAWRIEFPQQYSPPVMHLIDQLPTQPFSSLEHERDDLFCRLFRLPSRTAEISMDAHLRANVRYMVAR